MGVPCSKEAQMQEQMRVMAKQLSEAQQKIAELEQRDAVDHHAGAEANPRLLGAQCQPGIQRKTSKQSKDSQDSKDSQGSMMSKLSKSSLFGSRDAFFGDRDTRKMLATAYMGPLDKIHETPAKGDGLVSASGLGRL
eukprot:TRINITY_DN41006_c0_g1_i1.p2 TRINITY_DN41006_c0_g1~~TRINITY_DN41006_c0_g1_i1.p2  ORF type:complete len:137 (+),score=33.66 TRINITY_DN41006_c0_g1_i1:81-491(+)